MAFKRARPVDLIEDAPAAKKAFMDSELDKKLEFIYDSLAVINKTSDQNFEAVENKFNFLDGSINGIQKHIDQIDSEVSGDYLLIFNVRMKDSNDQKESKDPKELKNPKKNSTSLINFVFYLFDYLIGVNEYSKNVIGVPEIINPQNGSSFIKVKVGSQLIHRLFENISKLKQFKIPNDFIVDKKIRIERKLCKSKQEKKRETNSKRKIIVDYLKNLHTAGTIKSCPLVSVKGVTLIKVGNDNPMPAEDAVKFYTDLNNVRNY